MKTNDIEIEDKDVIDGILQSLYENFDKELVDERIEEIRKQLK